MVAEQVSYPRSEIRRGMSVIALVSSCFLAVRGREGRGEREGEREAESAVLLEREEQSSGGGELL